MSGSPGLPTDWTTGRAGNRDRTTLDGLIEAKGAGMIPMEDQEEFRAETFGLAERTAAALMAVAHRPTEDFPWDGMSNCRRKKGS